MRGDELLLLCERQLGDGFETRGTPGACCDLPLGFSCRGEAVGRGEGPEVPERDDVLAADGMDECHPRVFRCDDLDRHRRSSAQTMRAQLDSAHGYLHELVGGHLDVIIGRRGVDDGW